MKSEKIDKIKNKFHREWLLIAVHEMNESTTTPIAGKLIAHSPHRDEIYRMLLKRPRTKKVLMEYSEDSFPKGFAAAF